MPLRRSLLALFILTSVGFAADVRLLDEKVVKGDIESINAKEVSVKTENGVEVFPIGKVVDIEFGGSPGLPPKAAGDYSNVELTDGTLLRSSNWVFKGTKAQVKLVDGQDVEVDIGLIRSILRQANNENILKAWQDQALSKKRTHDAIGRMREDQLNLVEGTLGAPDGEGKTIAFTLTSGKTVALELAKLQGLQFVRGAPNAAPMVCKLFDSVGNVLMVSEVAKSGNDYTITTTVGPKINFTASALARMDYSRGKVTYLSEMTPVRKTVTSTDDYIQQPRMNANLDGEPMRIAGLLYKKGLALHARTELEYNLAGDYREFKALVGFDDQVNGSDGPVILSVIGDGQELRSVTLDRGTDKKPKELLVNVKDVSRLRIVVKSGTLLDLGKHLELADAKVSK